LLPPRRDRMRQYASLVTVKERLHRVIDELTDAEAEAALRRIDALRSDPLVRFLDAAPVDDEPVTPDEEAAVAEADAARAAGEPSVSFDEIKRRHGA
jgi:hypothetical protein